MQILITLGIGLMCTDGVLLVFGADYHQINLPLLGKNLQLGPHISVNAPWVVSFGIAGTLALALYLFVMRTMTGRAARAIAQNRYAARSWASTCFACRRFRSPSGPPRPGWPGRCCCRSSICIQGSAISSR